MKPILFFFRVLNRNKMHSFILVFGFGFALSFVILLSLYLKQELSVDGFHPLKERIVGISNEKKWGFAGPVGPAIVDQYPEVENYCRIFKFQVPASKERESANLSCPIIVNGLMVDSSFFKMFNFPVVIGNSDLLFRSKYGIILSSSAAYRIFGEKDPIGEILTFNPEFKCAVVGIMEDFPINTSFGVADAILDISSINEFSNWKDGDMLGNLQMNMFSTLFLEKEGRSLVGHEEELYNTISGILPAYSEEYAPKRIVIEHLEEMYFSPYFFLYKSNDKKIIIVVLAVAILILLLAVGNYINLSVAQTTLRNREFATRKFLGSSSKQLFFRFIFESVGICLLSFFIGVIMSVLWIPFFNKLLFTDINYRLILDFPLLIFLLVVVVCIGVISGVIPASLIVRHKMSEILKGNFQKKSKEVYGKILISIQYFIVMLLMACSFVLLGQTYFLKTFDLGYLTDNVIRVPFSFDPTKRETIRNELFKLPGVSMVAFANGDPIDGGIKSTIDYNDTKIEMSLISVDTCFFRLMNMEVSPTGGVETEGAAYRNWSMRNGKTTILNLKYQSAWLNETAVRKLNLGNLPKEFKIGERIQPVRGIVKDFYAQNLETTIPPFMILPLQEEETPLSLFIKLDSIASEESLSEIRNTLGAITKDNNIEVTFLSSVIAQWYQKVTSMTKGIVIFSALAVILDIMGLYAMSSYYINQRKKEIGVRRVYGDTPEGILWMLIRGYLVWIFISFILMIPIAYILMDNWLNSFQNHTSIHWWVFPLAGIITFFITSVVIVVQGFRIATQNPSDSMNSEG